MNAASFRSRFPEFRTAPDSLVQSVLAEAAGRVDGVVYGSLAASAIGYLAAHLLATSPFGKNLRLDTEGEGSGYETEYLKIRRQVVVHMTVT